MSDDSEIKEHSNGETSNSRDYIFRVVGLVIGNIIGLIGLYFVAHQTEDWNSWANVVAVWVLGLASLNVVIISAITSSEMIETMQHQELEVRLQRKTTQKQLAAMNSTLTEMRNQRELMTFQIAQTASQVVSARDQVTQMIGQGETMTEGLKQTQSHLDQNERLIKLTEETFYISERAYISVDNITPDRELIEPTSTDPVTFILHIRNSGRTPARKMTVGFASAWLQRPITKDRIKPVFPEPEGDPLDVTAETTIPVSMVMTPSELPRQNNATNLQLTIDIRVQYLCILNRWEDDIISCAYEPKIGTGFKFRVIS